jgi:hypothetical protein
LSERLRSFSTIAVDDTNPLKIEFVGTEFTREITFADETSASEFWEFLQSQGEVELLPGVHRSFVIRTGHSWSSLSSYIPSAAVGVMGLLSSTYKFIVGSESEKDRKSTEVTGFTLGYITGSISDVELLPFKGSVSGVRFSTVILNSDQMQSIWVERLKASGNDTDDYRNLSQQWKLISQNQWFHSNSLRSYVVAVETAIQACAYGSSQFNLLLFDVLMSLFAFSFMKLTFDRRFLWILEIIVSIVVREPRETGFETNTGETLSFEETAALVFWVLKGFLDRFIIRSPKCRIPSKSDLFLPTKSILSSVSPSTAALLDEKGVTNLDFCERDISRLFLRHRPLAASQLFLTALITNPDPPRFIECTLCSVLVLLHTRLEPVEDEAGFKQLFEGLLPTIDIRLLLYNVETLLGVLQRTDDH